MFYEKGSFACRAHWWRLFTCRNDGGADIDFDKTRKEKKTKEVLGIFFISLWWWRQPRKAPWFDCTSLIIFKSNAVPTSSHAPRKALSLSLRNPFDLLSLSLDCDASGSIYIYMCIYKGHWSIYSPLLALLFSPFLLFVWAKILPPFVSLFLLFFFFGTCIKRWFPVCFRYRRRWKTASCARCRQSNDVSPRLADAWFPPSPPQIITQMPHHCVLPSKLDLLL